MESLTGLSRNLALIHNDVSALASTLPPFFSQREKNKIKRSTNRPLVVEQSGEVETPGHCGVEHGEAAPDLWVEEDDDVEGLVHGQPQEVGVGEGEREAGGGLRIVVLRVENGVNTPFMPRVPL